MSLLVVSVVGIILLIAGILWFRFRWPAERTSEFTTLIGNARIGVGSAISWLQQLPLIVSALTIYEQKDSAVKWWVVECDAQGKTLLLVFFEWELYAVTLGTTQEAPHDHDRLTNMLVQGVAAYSNGEVDYQRISLGTAQYIRHDNVAGNPTPAQGHVEYRIYREGSRWLLLRKSTHEKWMMQWGTLHATGDPLVA